MTRADEAIVVGSLTTEDAFLAIRPEWDQLVDELALPSPFQSWQWNWTWWKHFGRRQHLQILAFRQGGRLVGIAPYFRKRIALPPLSMSALVPLGWEGYGQGNGLTEQWELLFPPHLQEELLVALTRWLRREPWTAALLPGCHEELPLTSWMQGHVAYRGHDVVFTYRRLPARWDDLLQGLGKSMRDNVKYYPRLMQRHGHTFSFKVAQTPAELTAWLPVLFDLHRERAHANMSVRHPDYFEITNRRAFMTELGPLLAGAGQLRIGVLLIDNQPVAAQMWLERGRVMFVYYSGYRMEWAAHSVALITTMECFRDGMRRGIDQVEFLAGGGFPKERWGTKSRKQGNVWLVRWPRLARLMLKLPIHYRGLA
jgi:CelD/BcsL family acetyltransferase involved in cellulose biosynthesis